VSSIPLKTQHLDVLSADIEQGFDVTQTREELVKVVGFVPQAT